jgi:DNA-3-methyladenine glycosylase II
MVIASPETLREAEEYLMAHDTILKSVIEKYRPCDITPHSNYYQELVESIVGQQLSVKAARAIRLKFVALFGGTFPTPEQILEKQPEEFRTAGLSWAKAKYVRDIAEHVVSGKIRFDHLDQLSNEEVIKELTDIKGVGEWTAHMFLIFLMGRLDILPVGDLGIKNGIRQLYGLKSQPTTTQMQRIAKKNHWHPYESVASWYIWASLDNEPKD